MHGLHSIYIKHLAMLVEDSLTTRERIPQLMIEMNLDGLYSRKPWSRLQRGERPGRAVQGF